MKFREIEMDAGELKIVVVGVMGLLTITFLFLIGIGAILPEDLLSEIVCSISSRIQSGEP